MFLISHHDQISSKINFPSVLPG